MKKLFAVVVLSLTVQFSQAKIWRVNNTGVNTDFTTAQAAHDGALAGDTLHFEASGGSYGNLNISKKLIIIGDGYILGTAASNSNPDLQANPAGSVLGIITFYAGSNGTVIEGITTNNMMNIQGGVSNILVRRNLLTASLTLGACNNVQILQNYISGFGNIGGDGNASTNLQINNNIIGNYVALGPEDNGDLMNNILASYAAGPTQVYNFRVWNNINIQGTFSGGSNDVRNNISNTTQFGNANGNQINVIMSTVFEDVSNSSPAFSEDSRFMLKAGSPAIGTANGGGDIGIFGTSTGSAYALSGIPNVPSIYKLTAPSSVSGNTINLTISTKTNQ